MAGYLPGVIASRNSLPSSLEQSMHLSPAPEIKKLLQAISKDRLEPEAVLFSYLAADYFKVLRYPTHQDRASDGELPKFKESQLLFRKMDDEQLSFLLNEFAKIYDYTQQRLKSTYPGQSSVTLYRSIGGPCTKNLNRPPHDNPEIYPVLVEAAQAEGQSFVEIEVDIVSGWSRAAQPVYGSLTLKKDWPLQDVILVSDHMDALCTIGPMESDEWLCINRSRSGLIRFGTSDCTLNSPKGATIPYRDAVAQCQAQLAERSRHFRIDHLNLRPMRASSLHRFLSWIARISCSKEPRDSKK